MSMSEKVGSIVIEPKKVSVNSDHAKAQRDSFMRDFNSFYKKETSLVQDCGVPNRRMKIFRDYNG